MDAQSVNNSPQSTEAILSISETQSSYEGERVYSDAEPNTEIGESSNQEDYYALTHNPRGVCMVINNEVLFTRKLKKSRTSQEDARALHSVFTRLGFKVVIHNHLTAEEMRRELKELGNRNFLDDDALVVCILSAGEKGFVFGTDKQRVSLQELTQPFKSGQAPTLAGKPKLFFIEGSQVGSYQRGSLPRSLKPKEDEGDRQAAKLPYMQTHFGNHALEPSADSLHRGNRQNRLEEDAGRVDGQMVPYDTDFLLGMATVPGGMSFRHSLIGSIYTQELCRQLNKSAESSRDDDILTVLTRVNRELSKGEYQEYKQMPEYKCTLTKKLVLKFV